MPSYNVHCKTSIEFFGRSYYRLHRAMDRPVFIYGRTHREYFHDDASAIVFANQLYPGDPVAVIAAKFHIELDWLCSADPVFKWRLEKWARSKVRKRSKSNKSSLARRGSRSGRANSKSVIDEELKRLFKDVGRLAEIEKMAQFLREC